MRPTPTEQLASARRILGELVAPHVAGEYPAALLAGVIDALGVLERGWEEVPRFLVRDTERLRELLAEQGKALEAAGSAGPIGDHGELLGEIASFVATQIPDATELRALGTHHERGRELLVRAVPALADADPIANSASMAATWSGSEALLRYFDDHIREFPLRPAPRVPPTSTESNSAPEAKGSPSC
ncbi:hypothetical protein [Yinghuangia sp. YIM S09857]|uniref:hypothetical protein n=1 Tax=Yinghuangia sp. YIM S09857 TaxID=3436929 RepID=UPI003F52EAD6